MGDEAPPPTVRQLRLVVEADDFDAAVAFYRDALPQDGSSGGVLQPAFGRLEMVNLHRSAPTHNTLIDGNARSTQVSLVPVT